MEHEADAPNLVHIPASQHHELWSSGLIAEWDLWLLSLSRTVREDHTMCCWKKIVIQSLKFYWMYIIFVSSYSQKAYQAIVHWQQSVVVYIGRWCYNFLIIKIFNKIYEKYDNVLYLLFLLFSLTFQCAKIISSI
jgi:hypothetical protein